MKNVANTIEDLLEILAGLQGQSKMQIESSDATIMYSIARQSFKGTALTDRQYALMKEKLQTYRDQFTALDYDFDRAIDALRQPLRHIDRSKYIKLVSHSDTVGPDGIYESYKNDWKWIKVRFPFSKTLIIDVQSIRHKQNEYYHEKGSHEHYFYFNESNVVQIISTFKNKNFEIDRLLLDYYEKVKLFDNERVYAPGIVDFKFNNIHPKAQELAVQELGEPCTDNILKYKDRANVYGIRYFDSSLESALANTSTITRKVVERKSQQVFASTNKWSFDQVVVMLHELDRFPLVIFLNEADPADQLVQTHQAFKNLFEPHEMSVQFRLSSDKDDIFNLYIKEHGLNSPVDKDTKIVYTSVDKLNKPLLQSECKPRTAILLNSLRFNLKIDAWLTEFDLIVHHDENISQFARYRRDAITEV